MKELSMTVPYGLSELRSSGNTNDALFKRMKILAGHALIAVDAVQGLNGKSTVIKFEFNPTMKVDFVRDSGYMAEHFEFAVDSVSSMSEIVHYH